VSNHASGLGRTHGHGRWQIRFRLTTGNRPGFSGSNRRFEIANPVVAQWETSNNWSYQDQSFANPLLCGRTARRGATLFLEQRAKAVPAQTAL
jgi:hypothetical protein